MIRMLEQSSKAQTDSLAGVLDYLSLLKDTDFHDPDLYSEYSKALIELHKEFIHPASGVSIRWPLNRIRHLLLQEIGKEPAEWDLHIPGTDRLDASSRRIFPCRVYLDEIRSPFNLGSIFRTADCFGVEKIFLTPGTVSPTHPRALRSSMGSIDTVPWEIQNQALLENEENLFALETGGTDIEYFSFPPTGICIIGSEELGIHPDLLILARQKRGIVSIPLFGSKGSLNVSVAFGILMHRWVRQLAPHLEPIRT